MKVRTLTDDEVLAAYEPLIELYPYVPPLIQWRIWEYAAYQAYSLRSPVLDLGCGDGRFFRAVWPQVTGVVGIDHDAGAVERARAGDIYDEVHLSSASTLPVASGHFASIFANCSLEHMNDLPDVVAELSRCAKPEADVVLSVVTDQIARCDSLSALLRVIGSGQSARATEERYFRYHNLVNLLSVEAWVELLEQAGLEVVEHVPILPEFSARIFMLADQLWHLPTDRGEIGDLVSQRLAQAGDFRSGFRRIIAGTLDLDRVRTTGIGAVFRAVKRNVPSANIQHTPSRSERADDHTGAPAPQSPANADIPGWLAHALRYRLPPGSALCVGERSRETADLLDVVGFDAEATADPSPHNGVHDLVVLDLGDQLDEDALHACLARTAEDGILLVRHDRAPQDERAESSLSVEICDRLRDWGAEGAINEPCLTGAFETVTIGSRRAPAAHRAAEVESAVKRASRQSIASTLVTMLAELSAIQRKLVASEERVSIAREDAKLRADLAELKEMLKIAENDRALRLSAIEAQSAELAKVTAERNRLSAQIEEAKGQAAAINRDRDDRLRAIQHLGDENGKLKGQLNEATAMVAELKDHLETSESDRGARLRVIEEQAETIGRMQAELSSLRAEAADEKIQPSAGESKSRTRKN